jgi:hypothetical protein
MNLTAHRLLTTTPTPRFTACGVLLVLGCVLAGCQPGIGDACETALRCSTSGSRLCDLTQPHGYCTLAGCDEGTCPPEAVCVTFWPKVAMQSDAERLGTNYCMLKCDTHSDCRDSDGYTCLGEDDFGAMNESKVLGNPKQRFCAVRTHAVTVDAGVLQDAGANMSVDTDE